MQIKTQPIKEAIEIRDSGIAFDVYNNGAKRIGDLAVTKNGLVWNKVNAQRTKGVTVKWDDFITWMQANGQSKAPARAEAQTRTPARTSTQAQTRTAPKAKIAAKPANGITTTTKKPAAKISASAKTARKKAH